MHFASFFFFNDTATTEIYTLSLHDALPIFPRAPPAQRGRHLALERARRAARGGGAGRARGRVPGVAVFESRDRKSTRLNSSHLGISYAVFCLKKKNLSQIPSGYRLSLHSDL